jgi:hypothetical protein
VNNNTGGKNMTKWKSLWEFKEFRAVVSCALLTTILAVSMCGVAVAVDTSDDKSGAGGTDGVYVVGFTLDPTNATFYSGSSQRFIATATVLNITTGGTTAKDVSSNVSWQSTIGSIDANGNFSAEEVGTGIIKVIYGTVSAEAIVTVNHGPIDCINITANDTTLVSHSELAPYVSIPFGLMGADNNGNKFLIPDASWTCSNPGIGNITQTGVFTFADGIVNDTSNEFNKSHPSIRGRNATTIQITAKVSAGTSGTATVNLTLNVSDNTVTSDNVDKDPAEPLSASFSSELMAVHVMAANGWDFGNVYPGTPTGWTKVTFKNIGTCDIRITPQPPIDAFDANVYKYAYLRDDGSKGDGAKMGSYSIDVPITPIYNNFGRIVSFSPDMQTAEVRLVPPNDLEKGDVTEVGSIRYLLTSI